MLINEINFEKISNQKLKNALTKISRLDKYCKLIPGGLNTYINIFEELGPMPSEYKEWVKLFNGGILFSVSIVSTDSKHPKFPEGMVTYKEVNAKEFKNGNYIPDEFICFGITIYGNLIGYEKNNPNEHIFEWDTDEDAIIREWNSFSDWLEEQVENAISDIKENLLRPFKDN